MTVSYGPAATEPSRPAPPDPLPLRWAVILLGGAVTGVLVGSFTFAQIGGWPAAMLAGLGAAGVAVPSFNQVVGR